MQRHNHQMSCVWFWEQRGGYGLEIMVMVSSTYGVSELVMVVLKRTVVDDRQSNNVETIFHLAFNTEDNACSGCRKIIHHYQFIQNYLHPDDRTGQNKQFYYTF